MAGRQLKTELKDKTGVADRHPGRVRKMFGRIAHRYDLMNSLMTAGMHHKWRRLGVEKTALEPGGKALDICCGTGDFAFSLYKAVGPLGSVTGLDFSRRMLDVAREKARRKGIPVDFTWGDATSLHFNNDSFDAVTVGFGVRNIEDLDKVFSEMCRVTKPGGKVVCLEITRPARDPFKSFYGIWFDRVVPMVGKMVSRDGSAYSYLPSSVKRFPPPDQLSLVMEKAGIRNVSYKLIAGGIIALHWGTA